MELLCSPNSAAFSTADNLLASDVAIMLLICKAFSPSNYWVNTDDPAPHFTAL